MDGAKAYSLAITAKQLAGEVGAKYENIVVTSLEGDKVLLAKSPVNNGCKTEPALLYTYKAPSDDAPAVSIDGETVYAFGEAIKHGGDSVGSLKKNKYPKTEYKVKGATKMIGSTKFVKEYYFHGTFRASDDADQPMAVFTYVQKNVRDENNEWQATVWRSMRCAADVDALGLFVAGLCLEQQWYWGFAMDED